MTISKADTYFREVTQKAIIQYQTLGNIYECNQHYFESWEKACFFQLFVNSSTDNDGETNISETLLNIG